MQRQVQTTTRKRFTDGRGLKSRLQRQADAKQVMVESGNLENKRVVETPTRYASWLRSGRARPKTP